MTNKEQAVSDAMIAAGEEVYAKWAVGKNGDTAIFKAIYLAMKAASHPLEQQQAVRGDKLVEQIARLPAQTCGDFDCDAEVGEKTARKIIALTASGMRTWQPIETAPLDGSIVLLWHGIHQISIAAFYKAGCAVPWFEATLTTRWPMDAFTHWMPLPEPPRTALQEEGVERRD